MIRRISRPRFAYHLATLVACLGLFGLASTVDAQQPQSLRHIGVLLVAFSPENKKVQEFRQGLLDAGYTEGRDVVVDWLSARGDYDLVPKMVTDLVQRKVDVIVVENSVAAKALKSATSTIPIVMAVIADPVAIGVVASLAHPGGNFTGLSMMTTDLTVKRLHLLKEVAPHVVRAAVLSNPDNPFHAKVIRDLKAAAPSLSIELSFDSVATPEQIAPAFAAIRRARAQALYVVEDALLFRNRSTILRFASEAKLPIVHGAREFAEEGGLMSYGVDLGHLFRRSAWYVDKILKGANPSDLPIEQPTKFELFVNLRTAKTLGLTIQQAILLRADEVIQ